MTYLRGNHAVRTERWRYIRYADGSEELYDHANDPEEWVNLALDKDHRKVMDGLRRHIPTEDALQVRDLK
jgi:arylsulfatase A-like enzyme